MKEVEVIIKDEISDVRLISELVQTACGFESEIKILYKEKNINAKSLMGMMALNVSKDDVITIQANGTDEEAAVASFAESMRKL